MKDEAIHIYGFYLQETRKFRLKRWVKRAFDLGILLGVHLFPFTLPFWVLLWVLIPLAIKLDDGGPIFYRQRRVGKNGKVFTLTKFRTMSVDAERDTGAVWSTVEDDRVTRVGRLLRWTALDELPQVVSILKGDMSFVGPRPERPELHERFAQEVPGFERRLRTLPGLTGLAQVMGPYDMSPAEKLRYDLRYIREMSLWLDIKIMALSIMNTLLARWDRPSADKGKAAIEQADDD